LKFEKKKEENKITMKIEAKERIKKSVTFASREKEKR
jgi:hypothetical protein